MKFTRRKFIQTTSVFGTGLLSSKIFPQKIISKFPSPSKKIKPLIISTWDHGLSASKKSLEILNDGGSVLDAVEK